MKKILWLAFSGLIPLAILCFILYIFDPLQLFHKPYLRKTIFNSNMHYQAAGIINNYHFNSIILGSSIMTNTSSLEANHKLGSEWVNLSVSGGSIQERLDILKYAIDKKKIKNILFTLEPNWLNQKHLENKYAYLYDKNRFNDFKTYLNENFIFCLFIHKICLKGEENLDHPSQWITQDWVQKLLGGFPSWIANQNRPDIQKILNQIKDFTTNHKASKILQFPPELESVIMHHPHITFFLIIPPFSRLYYKLQPIDIKQAIKSLLQRKLPNIKIYGFDNTNIPDDLSHYIDLVHYDSSINSLMLDAIKNDTHRITLENIDSYFHKMQQKVEAYNIEPFKKRILAIPEFKTR